MTQKKSLFTPDEITLVEQLRRHPELKERFEAILAISETQGGRLVNADEAEALMVVEVRKLGGAGMAQWAKSAEERSGREHLQKHPEYYCGKKNG